MRCDNLLVTAYIYILKKDYENALIYLEQCLELSSNIGYKLNTNSCYLNYADVYRIQENYQQALAFSEKSIALSMKVVQSIYYALVNIEKGKYFMIWRN